MTEIKLGTHYTRLTATEIRRRPIVVELHPGFQVLRLKGTRTAYHVSHEAVFNLAARIAAERARQERIEARKAKKRGEAR